MLFGCCSPPLRSISFLIRKSIFQLLVACGGDDDDDDVSSSSDCSMSVSSSSCCRGDEVAVDACVISNDANCNPSGVLLCENDGCVGGFNGDSS